MTEMVPAATIATAALVELGVVASDETPSATDQALAVDKVASVHAALDAQGVVWWDGTAMPRAFAEEYTKLTANVMASSFGRAADPANQALLEARVRKGAMTISGHDIAVEAVMAVHADLVARGWARWTTLRHTGCCSDALRDARGLRTRAEVRCAGQRQRRGAGTAGACLDHRAADIRRARPAEYF